MRLTKKDIKNNHFPTMGMIIITVLGSVGILLIKISNILKVENYKMLYDCISKDGMSVIFGLFFIFVCLYCWYLYFMNVIKNPKKEILFLIRREKDNSIFVNKNGKIFIVNSCNKLENKYYYVIKTNDYICEILNECNEVNLWMPKEKKSYWLNFYSPMGNFENIFLLPIVYVILIPFVLSFLMAKGWYKIYGLILSICPIYIIVYDLVYKIKIKTQSKEEINNLNITKIYLLIVNIIKIILSFVLCFFLLNIFFRISNGKIFFTPFVLCGFCTAGLMISQVLKNSQFENLFLKGYRVIFFSFWFIFITYIGIGLIKQERDLIYIVFLIPFYLFGIYGVYKYFIKK